MDSHPTVSVIIPVYQAADYIETCLSSLISQDYPGKVECILVDDRGSDGSMEIAGRFLEHYSGPISFIILSHERTRGAAAARNTGIEAATGEYLFFLDSDDYLAVDTLTSLSSPLMDCPYDLVVGRHQEVGALSGKGYSLPDGTILSGHDIIRNQLLKKLTINVWNKLINRSFVLNNNLFFKEGIIYEDDLWCFQSSSVAQSLCVVDKITYYYTIREGSVMSSTVLQKRIDSYLTILQEMYKCVQENGYRMNPLCHNRIEQYRLDLFRMLSDEQKGFFRTYSSLREVMPKPWRDCFRMDGWRINKQIRDLHLALPVQAGAAYLYLWIKIESIIKSSKRCQP